VATVINYHRRNPTRCATHPGFLGGL